MTTSTQWQLARDAAERYEHILVPAILGPFAGALVAWADPQPGAVVLDVGCGTGTAARQAAARVGPAGRVIGVDVNPGMIAVAQSLPHEGAPIEWRQESAYQISLADESVDLALCAQTLQFLDQRPAALSEMRRVLRPGGSAALSLWQPIEESPYFHALVDAVAQQIDPQVAMGLRSAFALTDADEIRALLAGAGFTRVELTAARLELDLPAPEEFVPRHVGATPMAAGFAAASEAARSAVVRDMAERMAPYMRQGGMRVPFGSYLARGYRPA